MSFINSIKIKSKFMLMLGFPIAGLFYFSIDGIWEKSRLSSEMKTVEGLSSLAVKISAMVHEVQKERGSTGIFIGSRGKEFVSELRIQRAETDKKIVDLKKLLNNFDTSRLGVEFKNSITDGLVAFDDIELKRETVDKLTIPAVEMIIYYNNLIDISLNIIAQISKLSTHAEISTIIAAYTNFLSTKERAGRERAVLTNVFAQDKFGKGMFDKFNAIVAEQETYTNVFLSFATYDQKGFYKIKMRGPFIDETARIRKIVFENGNKGGFGIDASYWFKIQTGKINLLKEVEDRLSNDLSSKAGQLKSQAQTASALFILLTVVIFANAIVWVFIIIRAITRQSNLRKTFLGMYLKR
ncbi:MAG: nitrate- and nitrite sensing domain-containing protein [Deltaproteobacteria bacterium]|nr:nitrate- and nitrite sensing domain-containing protein [Deltaproteobacteria bacterium]